MKISSGKTSKRLWPWNYLKKPIISETLEGKEASVILTIPKDEAYNHMRTLYVIAQFNGQLVLMVLVNNMETS